MLEFLIELVLNIVKIFLVYVSIPVVGLPVGIMIVAIVLFVLPAIIVIGACILGALWLIKKAWQSGWKIIQLFCWLIYRWLNWAIAYRRWVIPPLTLLTWWIPGAVFVPLFGGLVITVIGSDVFFGILFGIIWYMLAICFVLLVGENYSSYRQRMQNQYRRDRY